jgi:polysaccharide transporter, PST family
MHPLFQVSSHQLKRDAQRASVLNLTGRSIELLFQFAGLAILARVLTPSDFGVYAMATPFVWIIMNFGDLGLASAVLQQRDLNEGQASAVFRVNLLAGLAFAGLFLAASPLIGLFYHDPRVTQVAAALSLTFVFSGFTAVQRALLRRALLFDALLRAQIAASAVSSVVAVIFALNGAGYWALTARALVDPLTYTIVVWSLAGWLPGRAEWDSTTKFLLRYGRYTLGSTLFYSVWRQTDSVLIGWRFGSVELGPYALATRLFLLPVDQISSPLGHVMIPALSRLRDDPDRLRRWYSKLLRLVTFVAFPPMFSLVFCADDVVYFVAGPQWGKAADILRLLAPVGALYAAYATTDWLIRSQGHADRSFRWSAISATAYLICFILGLPWGAIGVAAGLAAANFLLFVPAFVYAARGTSIRLIDVLKAMLPSFALMIVTAGAVYALRIFIAEDWHPIVRLLVTGGVIAAIMTCGIALVYGRSLLSGRLLTSDAT